MKVLLIALGSRGDIEPFFAIAQWLQQDQHEVICVFPEQFERDVQAMGLVSHPFASDFLAISQTPECKLILGGAGSFLQRMSAYRSVYKALLKLQPSLNEHQQSVIAQYRPDKVIFNALCTYSIYWSYFHSRKSVQVLSFPFIAHPDNKHRFLSMHGTRDRGTWINVLSYLVMNTLKAKDLNSLAKNYPISTVQKPISLKKWRNHYVDVLPSLYPISIHLFTKPVLWKDNVYIPGYLERDVPEGTRIPEHVQQFLNRNDQIILVSFGSMTNDKPDHFTQMILDIAIKHRLAVIFNTASGGIKIPTEYPDHVIFIEYIPFKLILPRIYAVLHHGGTGTTHLSVKYGCVSILIPHILDQFFWADTIYEKKLGPKAIPIYKLTPSKLELVLMDALSNKEYKQNAERISREMCIENTPAQVLQMILP